MGPVVSIRFVRTPEGWSLLCDPSLARSQKSDYLRVVKSSELLRKLKRLGATIETGRGKGGHLLVRLNGRCSTVPTGSGDIKTGTLKAILKQLGISESDLS
jgi:mRNA interferase HicA